MLIKERVREKDPTVYGGVIKGDRYLETWLAMAPLGIEWRLKIIAPVRFHFQIRRFAPRRPPPRVNNT